MLQSFSRDLRIFTANFGALFIVPFKQLLTGKPQVGKFLDRNEVVAEGDYWNFF